MIQWNFVVGAWRNACLTCLMLLGGLVQAKAPQPEPDIARPPVTESTYVVRKGDNLYNISLKANGDPKKFRLIQDINKIALPKKLKPGQVIRIPDPSPNLPRLTYINGNVLIKSVTIVRAAKLNDQIQIGDEVFTDQGSYAAISQSDGSKLMLYPLTHTVLEPSELVLNEGVPSKITKWRLVTGKTKADISPQGANRFRVYTPLAIAGVRGTKFRIDYDAESGSSRNEVLEGTVWVKNQESSVQTQDVVANFGIVADKNGVSAPKALLPAPAWPFDTKNVLQESKIQLLPVPLAKQYFANFYTKNSKGPLFRLSNIEPEFDVGKIEPGEYRIEFTAKDDHGLEGQVAVYNTAYLFNPLHSLNAKKIVQNGRSMFGLSWIGHPMAKFSIELAEDPEFKKPIWSWAETSAHEVLMAKPPASKFYWRVKSKRSENGVQAIKVSPTQVFPVEDS